MLYLYRKSIIGRRPASTRFLQIVLALTASLYMIACECGLASDESAIESVDSGRCDGSDCSNAEKEVDASPTQVDSSAALETSISTIIDTGASETEPKPGCLSVDDCEKSSFCVGEVRCVFDDDQDAGVFGHCECNCDSDYDGVLAERCGGDDCNDENPNVRPGIPEVCDPDGVDEDCDVSTCSSEDGDPEVEDKDGDGHISKECYNIDRVTGKKHYAKKWDCDDTRDNVYDGATEECDNLDNDCDNYTDEKPNEDEHGGLRHTYYPDEDGDHWGSKEGMIRACSKPPGYVERSEEDDHDCDDQDNTIYPLNEEICDCKDNDCDGETDEPDEPGSPLFDQPTCANTQVLCSPDKCTWTIPEDGCPDGWLHCDEDSILQCCETPDNTLSTCKACSTNCLFSCGEEGCDEIEAFSIGRYHACGYTMEGLAACWGRNNVGQLGNGSTSVSFIPSPVFGLSNVVDISAATFHTCAIANFDRRLYCWGSNEYRQLGVADIPLSSPVPYPVPGINAREMIMSNVASVATGDEHSCAVLDDGTVACWGNQEFGRLGNDHEEQGFVDTPRRVQDFYFQLVDNGVQVVAGFLHSCLLTDDAKVLCWGDNTYGQLGVDGEVVDPDLAQEVSGLSNLIEDGSKITYLSAGSFHTCALASSGKVYCWGYNNHLQLGRPGNGEVAVPQEVPGLSDIVEIATGNYHSCAVSASKDLMCWGGNQYGERGDRNLEDTDQPQTIKFAPLVGVAAGGHVTCARTDSGQGVCWGNSLYHQLGDGQFPEDIQPIPQPISALDGSTS